MKEFFGFGGYTREPEGYFSWQHIVFVTALLAVMTLLAIVLGKSRRNSSIKAKNNVLIAAALLIDGFELLKF